MYLETDVHKLKEIARGFEMFTRSQLPHCIGIVDGTHIRIRSGDLSYANHKGFKSINVQVFIDHRGRIRDCGDEWTHTPGSRGDMAVYNVSDLRCWIEERARDGVLGQREIGGEWMSWFVAADGGYALRPSLMIPYTKERGVAVLPEYQGQFNFWFSSTRMLVEEVIGVVKGKWKILTSFHNLPYSPDEVQNMFTTCAILHNFIITNGEGPEWRRQTSEVDHPAPFVGPMEEEEGWENNLQAGKDKRECLMAHLQEVHDFDESGDEMAEDFNW